MVEVLARWIGLLHQTYSSSLKFPAEIEVSLAPIYIWNEKVWLFLESVNKMSCCWPAGSV